MVRLRYLNLMKDFNVLCSEFCIVCCLVLHFNSSTIKDFLNKKEGKCNNKHMFI